MSSVPTRFYVSRRTFLSHCAALAAATGLPRWFVERELSAQTPAAPSTSPNDRPGIAIVGCGGMGRSDAKAAARFGNIVALCDVDESHSAAFAKTFANNGKAPDQFTDFRKVLDRKDVDIVVNVTPDHWHTIINLAAADAKKDVYAEKPLTLTIDEGKRVVKAVRKHKIVLQTGTQQRSHKLFRFACELARNGRIGTLKTVTVYLPAGLREGPFAPQQSVPAGFNWDFWLGQAPQVDYLKERTHQTFRWWWDYSGGPVTDWGAHHNDTARWAIGLDGPTEIEAKVITPPIEGGYTTPQEFEAELKWANGVTQIVKTTKDDSPFGAIVNPQGQRNGVRLEGTDGWIWVNRSQLEASDPSMLDKPLDNPKVKLDVSDDHMGNFIDAVRTRKNPISPVEEGHRSAVIGHLIVIALRTGKALRWNPAKEKFEGNGEKEANAHLARPQRKPYTYDFT
jgi:predicted dehydrogenase